MAAPHIDDHIEEHHSFIQTPRQLITVVILAFAVPITVIALLAKLVLSVDRFDANHPAMTDEAIAQRIKPVGHVRLGDGSAAESPVVAGAATAPAGAKPAATPMGGKGVYDTVCMVCHATGIAGAPKTGDKAAWAPHLQHGIEALYTSALKGKGAMPPKGGATQVSDADIKAAVDHMVGLVK